MWLIPLDHVTYVVIWLTKFSVHAIVEIWLTASIVQAGRAQEGVKYLVDYQELHN